MKIFFNQLRAVLDPEDYWEIIKLFSLILTLSVVELIGITAIMPFLSMATNPAIVSDNDIYQFIYRSVGFSDVKWFIVSYGLVLVTFYIFRGLITVITSYKSASFYHGKYYKTSVKLLNLFLNLRHVDFLKTNSSFLTKSLVSETQLLSNMLAAIAQLITELMVISFILFVFMLLNLKVFVCVVTLLLIFGCVAHFTVTKKIKASGVERAHAQADFFETINRALSSYKVLKMTPSRAEFITSFSAVGQRFARILVTESILHVLPRIFLEAIAFIGVTSIIIYLYVVSSSLEEIGHHLGVLSVFALGLMRLLPSFNRIISSFNSINFHKQALAIIANNLSQDIEEIGQETIPFKHRCQLKDIVFEYENSNQVLCSVNLTIEKGAKICLTGKSGSGKSTLVDVLMGLLEPTSGMLLVDGNPVSNTCLGSWRAKVAYVPQDIHLFDGTVSENVALSAQTNEAELEEALKKAQIWDFLQKKDGINTFVGDKGVLLSGGQRQRIGIARAFYRKAEIIVFDEATSALDKETEADLLSEIISYDRSVTIVMISHRTASFSGFDKVCELASGRLRLVNTYET